MPNQCIQHITADGLCPICRREEETPVHILWNCPSARDVRLESTRKLQKCSSDSEDFAALVIKLMGLLKSDEVQLFATVARQIWFRRNAIVHGEALSTPSMVLRMAREQIEGYETAMAPLAKKLEPEHSIPQNTMLLWKAPPMGYIKLN